jgi:selenocysteine lyase/cysteine desulfurase
MKNNLFRSFFNTNTDKLAYIKNHIIGEHKNNYFDYTASGLAFSPIEERMQEVLVTYANTHSKEASMASQTSNYYTQAYANLHLCLDLDDSFVILPSGCGATAAIKRFQELIGIYIPPATTKRLNLSIDRAELPLVIVGPYEHHSNEVSYREALCEVRRVSLNSEGLIDLVQLETLLKENQHREIIGSFCIASNVTGIMTCYKEISKMLRKYQATVCFDAATSASYMNVECNYYDVMFLSSHKLLGGPGACGLLVIKKGLVDTDIAPTFSGGGTVTYVNHIMQAYHEDVLLRESAGTPGILQFIKASLAFTLRNEIGFRWIEARKKQNLHHFLIELNKIPYCTIYGNETSKNIGIVSFNIGDIDPYVLCADMSKKAGIQTRAGCSCAGPYGHDLLGIKTGEERIEKPGWLRISIHFSQTFEEIDRLLEAIKVSVSALSRK